MDIGSLCHVTVDEDTRAFPCKQAYVDRAGALRWDLRFLHAELGRNGHAMQFKFWVRLVTKHVGLPSSSQYKFRRTFTYFFVPRVVCQEVVPSTLRLLNYSSSPSGPPLLRPGAPTSLSPGSLVQSQVGPVPWCPGALPQQYHTSAPRHEHMLQRRSVLPLVDSCRLLPGAAVGTCLSRVVEARVHAC